MYTPLKPGEERHHQKTAKLLHQNQVSRLSNVFR